MSAQSKKTPENNEKTIPIRTKNYIPLRKINESIRDFFLDFKKLHDNIISEEELNRLDSTITYGIDSLNILTKDSSYQDFKKKSILELNYEKRYWNTTFDDSEKLNDQLSSYLDDIDESNKYILKKLKIWKNTLDTLSTKDTADVPHKLFTYVQKIIDTLNYIRDNTEDKVSILLELQDKVVYQQYVIKNIISRIEKAESKRRSLLFTIDYEPVWKSFKTDSGSISFTEAINKVYSNEKKSIILFGKSNSDMFVIHLSIFVLLLLTLIFLRFSYHEDDIKIPLSTIVSFVKFKNLVYRPVSSAIFISLFAGFFLYSNRTNLINAILLFLIYLTIIRLLWGLISKKNTFFFAGFGFIYLLNLLVKLIEGDLALQRWIVLFNTVVLLATMLYIFKPKSTIYKMEKGPMLKVLIGSAPVFILLLVGSLIGNIIGAVGFSILATTGFIDLSIVTIILIAASYLVASIAIVLLTKHFKNKPELEEKYLKSISQNTVGLIRFSAIILWFISGMRIFGVRDLVYYWFDQLMNFSIASGDTEIQLGTILTFFFIIVISFFIAKFVRIFLDIEVFSRIKLPRGIPGAISMVVKYSIVFIGIYLAISSIGIDLSKFGLLAGAMGVGLGFGLQNILSNFFSGIILAFERPVQTGDLVEVNNIYGRVQSIGVRSSVVKTLDGSEVFLPNNDLISKQLINWTMSDTKRRIKLHIKTAFGENPHKITEIILNIIHSREEVIEKPEPVVTFDGFGDYFLEFTAYYWLKDNYLVAKSKIAISIYDALSENGVKMPRQIGDFNVNLNNKDESVSEKTEQRNDKTDTGNIKKNTSDDRPKE
jgi:small-conductance mechanosensitive channel